MDKLHAMAAALIKWETIDKWQIEDIMKGIDPREPTLKPLKKKVKAKPEDSESGHTEDIVTPSDTSTTPDGSGAVHM